MGTISDALNPPKEFEVGGQKFQAKQISFADLYAILLESLKELGVDEVGTDLEAKAQECLDSVNIPHCAFPRILKRGGVGLDDDDVDALMRLDTFKDVMDVVRWMIGIGGDTEAAEDDPESDEDGQEKKSP